MAISEYVTDWQGPRVAMLKGSSLVCPALWSLCVGADVSHLNHRNNGIDGLICTSA